jgi:hypothetical protein
VLPELSLLPSQTVLAIAAAARRRPLVTHLLSAASSV